VVGLNLVRPRSHLEGNLYFVKSFFVFLTFSIPIPSSLFGLAGPNQRFAGLASIMIPSRREGLKPFFQCVLTSSSASSPYHFEVLPSGRQGDLVDQEKNE